MTVDLIELTHYLIETPFKAFANSVDPDACSGSTLFAYGNMMCYDPTLVGLTSNSLFYVPT